MSLTKEALDDISQTYIKADLLFSESEILSAIQQMARDISDDLAQSQPIVLPVLNGALIFAGHLLPQLPFPLETHYVHATRYGHHDRGQEIEWIAKPACNLAGRSVLIIDDILDEGVTLEHIANYCLDQGAAEVKVAVLLQKNHNRKVQLPTKRLADYVGLNVDDRFVFGFGMDYKGYWRNAPGIFAVRENQHPC